MLARVSPLFQLFCCVLGASGVALLSSLGVLHFLGSSFGNDFLGFRRNKGILLRPSDATSILSYPKKQRFRSEISRSMSAPPKARQDTGVVDENMMATVLSSALPARCRGAPASTSGTTPRRRLRAALARRGGSTSTSSSLKDPPPKEVFQGQFGAWTVDAEDEREVFLYRLGLSVAAVSWAATGLSLLSPAAPAWFSAAGYAVGSFAFGGSLALIHIYVTPAKRFLQGLFLVGLLGSVFIFTREDCAR